MADTTTKTAGQAIDERAVNAIRALAIDATQQAGSGHPGMPMGAAPMGYVLYTRVMKHNPRNPSWWNRDRYVQSAGHGSMLQYSLLHLTGYDLSMEELKNYRQWGSKTPGHPEVNHTPGVETTTGPLGQGISTAVGMALAEAHLAARYNRPDFEVIGHHTYVIASDGDIMEGVSSEASSFAGHHRLGKLIVIYDDNHISIDGPTSITFSEDVLARYQAYGWHTQRVDDGNNLKALEQAIQAARQEDGRPSLIAVRTTIGFGAPHLGGTSKVHGSPLGEKEARAAKENLGIDWPAFSVPEDVLTHYRRALPLGAEAEAAWQQLYRGYRKAHPEAAAELERVMAKKLKAESLAHLPVFSAGEGGIATRKASQQVLNSLAADLPELLGGSADLAASNYTDLEGASAIPRDNYGGRIVHFGIREHGMAAIANGMALHGGVRPFVATFMIFADYLRPALRLAALMKQPVIYLLTHDSIGLGGDGPTHQPVAHLMSLRAIPNVTVIRPADGNETAQAWAVALRHRNGPVVLALSRQALPHLDVPADSVARGGYLLAKEAGDPQVILLGTGSEVQLCLAAKEVLEQEGIGARVVSMPSFELFEEQEEEYREAVLPRSIRSRVAVEAGASLGWQKYTGLDGATVTLDHFGASGAGDVVMDKFGFNVETVVAAAKRIIG